MPQGQDIFMSLFAVDLLAASYPDLLIVAMTAGLPPTVVCCLVDPAEEHGHFALLPEEVLKFTLIGLAGHGLGRPGTMSIGQENAGCSLAY